MAQTRLYQGSYLADDDEDTQAQGTAGTSTTPQNDPNETPEDRNWKKRYGDLRSHTSTLTERIKSLEVQLKEASRKEVKIPSTKEELDYFAHQYPDVYRHIQSIAMENLKREREDISTEIQTLKEKSEKAERELSYAAIIKAHPDFNALNLSEDFHAWAQDQHPQIQNWLFESTDPTLCIKALDMYKVDRNLKDQPVVRQPSANGRADAFIPSRTAMHDISNNNRRIWRTSEIQALKPREYSQFEAEIDAAHKEGRIEFDM